MARPRFQPTPEQRRMVRAMAAYGIHQDDIAKVIDIDAKTLRRHFRAELDIAAVEANVKVSETLFWVATQRKVAGPVVTAAIWWEKTRMRWSDRTQIEVGTMK